MSFNYCAVASNSKNPYNLLTSLPCRESSFASDIVGGGGLGRLNNVGLAFLGSLEHWILTFGGNSSSKRLLQIKQFLLKYDLGHFN